MTIYSFIIMQKQDVLSQNFQNILQICNSHANVKTALLLYRRFVIL